MEPVSGEQVGLPEFPSKETPQSANRRPGKSSGGLLPTVPAQNRISAFPWRAFSQREWLCHNEKLVWERPAHLHPLSSSTGNSIAPGLA